MGEVVESRSKRVWPNLCLFFFSRKVVVLQKTEEEAFGFEIQVRGLTAIYGRDFLTSQAPFNRISLIGRRRWYFGDWNMNVWSCKSLNPNACLRRRGWKVTHQSNTPLMLVPWLKRRGDDFYSFSLSFPAFILSRVVCSHALHVIPASLPPARQADASHIRPQCLSRCACVMSPWSAPSPVVRTSFFEWFSEGEKNGQNVDLSVFAVTCLSATFWK